MRKHILLAVKALAAVAILLLASSSISEALNGTTRTWVSGVGDDANPCSRTAPCKTFAGAISKTAAGGEIDVLDPGGFGALTIVKSITIDGSGNFGSVLVSGTNGIVVQAGPNDVVTIRRLSINGISSGLSGIRFISGGILRVEQSEIFGFTQVGIDFEPSAASQLFVSDTAVHEIGGFGIYVKPGSAGSAAAMLTNVQVTNNSAGIRADDRSNVIIRNSSASGNVNNGYYASSTTGATSMMITDSSASNSTATAISAGVKSDGANTIVRIGGNTIFNNTVGLRPVNNGQIISFGNNNLGGNTADGAPTSTITQK